MHRDCLSPKHPAQVLLILRSGAYNMPVYSVFFFRKIRCPNDRHGNGSLCMFSLYKLLVSLPKNSKVQRLLFSPFPLSTLGVGSGPYCQGLLTSRWQKRVAYMGRFIKNKSWQTLSADNEISTILFKSSYYGGKGGWLIIIIKVNLLAYIAHATWRNDRMRFTSVELNTWHI